MKNKIKLIAVASLVAVMATGCSGYNRGSSQSAGSSEGDGYSSGGGSGQVSRGSQVSNSGQVSRGGLFGQRRPAASATCAPCASSTQPKSTYTYKPAPKPTYRAPASKPAYKPAPRPAGQHSQQWYVDRWKRQQAAGGQPAKNNTNYSGYGGNYTYDAASNNNTNYYDYSTAGKSKPANTNVSTSNKSIYTGSYQQKTYKPYKPTTYSGGSSASTNTTYSAPATTSGGGSTYTVKKGDTVFEIMRQTGVYWKDIIKMNNLQAPAYNINPGQIIRLK